MIPVLPDRIWVWRIGLIDKRFIRVRDVGLIDCAGHFRFEDVSFGRRGAAGKGSRFASFPFFLSRTNGLRTRLHA